MAKKTLFYDKYARTKKRLFILFLVMAFVSFGAGVGILKISNVKNIAMGIETIYKDRVKPLEQLKMLSDIYGNMIDIANRVQNGNLSWREGVINITEATKKIPYLWNEYINTYLVEEEIILVEDLKILFKSSDAALLKLNDIMLKEDHKALTEFINESLYQSMESILIKIDELFKMQVRIVNNIHEQEQRRHKLILNIGMASIVMSIVLSIIVVLQWRKVRALIDSL